MASKLRVLLLHDNVSGLRDWVLVYYDQLETMLLIHEAWHGDLSIFEYAVLVGAVRCVTWFLETGMMNANAVPPRLDPLHFVERNGEEMATVLLKYGANPNLRSRTNAPVSVLYRRAVWCHDRTDIGIARRLFWAGARLTDEDKHTLVHLQSERAMVDTILEAEAIMNRRVAQCRCACMIILRRMPGPRDCTRDWVRRMVWPTRHDQEWLPGVELPGFLREIDE